MLQVIRERAQGFFAWLIVGAIVLTLGLFGLSSYFNDTEEAFQAAKVKDEKVTVYEYQIAYANEKARMQQMFGDNFDPDMFDKQIKNSALDRVIDNALLIQDAQSHGMYVSDDQLAMQIQNIGAFKENGAFSKQLYEQQLAQAGESSAGFEYRIRRGMMADQLVNGIVATSFATKDEIELTYKLRDQSREISVITFPIAKFKDQVKVSDEEIKKHYDNNLNSYQTDEQVQLKYLELSVDGLMPKVSVDDSELQAYYKEQKNRFTTPEERKASHILIEFGDDEDAAKAKAESILAKAKAGEDFAKLAKENSDDIGSKSEGGDLGFFGRGVMDKNFEDAAFALNKGQISDVVRSQFGFHIIKLVDIKPSAGKSFADVKSTIEKEVRRQKAEKLYFDKSEKLANLTYETPDSLESAELELDLKAKTSPYISHRGGPGIFSDRKVIDAAFSDDVLKENLNSAAIEIGANKMVVVRLADHKAAAPKPLEQVKAQIKATLEKEKSQELAENAAKEFEGKIAKGEAVAKPAKDKGFEFKDKTWIKRTSTDVGREVISAAFSMPRLKDNKTQTKGITLNNGDYALVAFSGIKDGNFADLKDD
ncbi:MAG: SurA N-terminal domain-containing protein, partial [Gammaproteobacteria bacterium]|nr:SurA N-terminal domain-containing protein [Gammaproteobacteria bacterium]